MCYHRLFKLEISFTNGNDEIFALHVIALQLRLSLDSGFNANFLHVVVKALKDFMMNGIRFFPI